MVVFCCIHIYKFWGNSSTAEPQNTPNKGHLSIMDSMDLPHTNTLVYYTTSE